MDVRFFARGFCRAVDRSLKTFGLDAGADAGALWLWLSLLLLSLGGGCTSAGAVRATATAPTPMHTLAAYRAALERDDPASAYKLLGPSVRQQISLEKFSADWKEMQPERNAQLKLLSAAAQGVATTARLDGRALRSPAALSTKAIVNLPPGTALVLLPAATNISTNTRSLDRQWQIDEPDLSIVQATTPEEVLRLLVDAVEQRNYFAMLRLLSTAERQAIESELRERVSRLRMSLSHGQSRSLGAMDVAAAAAPTVIDIRGDRAHFQYDPRFFVDLVREKDGWRVLDIN